MKSKSKKDIIFNFVILIVYAAITLTAVLNHEIWRDEAQVWLVVRDLNLPGVIDHVRNEGHPLLWYFLVLPFAKLKLPVVSMQILSFLFMNFAAAIFLWKSPFEKITKFFVLFSAGFLYWLPVISRSYSLIPLFLFLLAVFYPKQKEHPYIYSIFNILLANTHILMFGFSGAIAMLFGYQNLFKNNADKKEYVLPFLLMACALTGTALYILCRPEENISVNIVPISSINFNSLSTAISAFFINIYAGTSFSSWFSGLCILAGSTLYFLVDKKVFFIFAVNAVYQFYIYTCVFITSPEKAFTFLLVMLFCFWIILQKEQLSKFKSIFVNLLVIIIFGLSLNLSYKVIKNDILYNYSGSKEASEFISKNIEKDAIIISNNPLTTAGILAYLPDRKFYLPFYNDFYTFGYGRKMDLSRPFEFKKPDKFKDKKVYYIYSALGEPDLNKNVVFISYQNILITTEFFFIIKDE